MVKYGREVARIANILRFSKISNSEFFLNFFFLIVGKFFRHQKSIFINI